MPLDHGHVTVEFFGIPRLRAGIAQTRIAVMGNSTTLGEVIQQLAREYPDLAKSCFDDGVLGPGTLANLDGTKFLSDPQSELPSGSCLLVLSADAGG